MPVIGDDVGHGMNIQIMFLWSVSQIPVSIIECCKFAVSPCFLVHPLHHLNRFIL